MKKDFRSKLKRKLTEEFPEAADYHFWNRFKKEGGGQTLVMKVWAPTFMLAVAVLISLSIYNSPETNQSMLRLESRQANQGIDWILEIDEETTDFFSDYSYIDSESEDYFL
jgi:hypothetical protein